MCIESLLKIQQLKRGGWVIAEQLGGTPLNDQTTNDKERRLKNIVEEMSIASGIVVPMVYILKREPGINAFVAGFTVEDAALAVTQGSLDVLSRDELQGVVAHEFSHIFNGDMRLNIQLMGFLNGILFLTELGYSLLRNRSYGRTREGIFPLGGFLLIVLGYIGYLFSRMIQSAVSREREYLADASAVQYTRNPSGLADALKKIGGFTFTSNIEHSSSKAIAHLTFANSTKQTFLQWFATHPPLNERIQRLDPSFKGEFQAVDFFTSGQDVTSDAPLLHIGQPKTIHMSYAKAFLDGLSIEIANAAKTTIGAKAIILCLLLDENEPLRNGQYALLSSDLRIQCQNLYPYIEAQGIKGRLPVFDYTVTKLKTLSAEEIHLFISYAKQLVAADQKISMFEWILLKLLTNHINPKTNVRVRGQIKYKTIGPLEQDIRVILSAMIHLCFKTDSDQMNSVYQKALKHITLKSWPIFSRKDLSIRMLHNSLERMDHASFTIKDDLLRALSSIVSIDPNHATEGVELLRAIGSTLHCPIPPLVTD